MASSTAQPLLFVVSGPSGAGKGTLLGHLHETAGVRRVPTYTTRAARPGEQPGVDYVFVDNDDFWAKVEAGEIFEYTRTYGDYAYGSPDRLIGLDPEPLAVELDYKGMFRVRARSPRRVVSIFVMTADWQTAAERITSRSAEKNLDARATKWQEQVQFAWAYDYVLINDSRERFASEAGAIATAELARTAGARALLDHRHDTDSTLG
jgi:guanylate kinase